MRGDGGGGGGDKSAPKGVEVPKKKAHPRLSGVSGDAKDGGGSELMVHLRRHTKPNLVKWLVEDDKKNGNARFRYTHSYSDETIERVRDTVRRRVEIDDSADSREKRAFFRRGYEEALANGRAKLDAKREQKRAVVKQTQMLLEATHLHLVPGLRFHLPLYRKGIGGQAYMGECPLYALVEVAAYCHDSNLQRLLRRDVLPKSPTARLRLQMIESLDDVDSMTYYGFDDDVGLPWHIPAGTTFTYSLVPLVDGGLVWRATLAGPVLAYGKVSILDSAAILEDPEIMAPQRIAAIDAAMRHSSGYARPLCDLIHSYLVPIFHLTGTVTHTTSSDESADDSREASLL